MAMRNMYAASLILAVFVASANSNLCPSDFGVAGHRTDDGLCVTASKSDGDPLAYVDYNKKCAQSYPSGWLHGFFSTPEPLDNWPSAARLKEREDEFELFHRHDIPPPSNVSTPELQIIILNGLRLTDWTASVEGDSTAATVELSSGNTHKTLQTYKYYKTSLLNEWEVKFMINHPEQLYVLLGRHTADICFVVRVRYVYPHFYYTYNIPNDCASIKSTHYFCKHVPYQSCKQLEKQLECNPGSAKYDLKEPLCDLNKYYTGGDDNATSCVDDDPKGNVTDVPRPSAQLFRRQVKTTKVKGKIFSVLEHPGLIAGIASGILMVFVVFCFFTGRRRKRQRTRDRPKASKSPFNVMSSEMQSTMRSSASSPASQLSKASAKK